VCHPVTVGFERLHSHGPFEWSPLYNQREKDNCWKKELGDGDVLEVLSREGGSGANQHPPTL
jgi:hypothetical protein